METGFPSPIGAAGGKRRVSPAEVRVPCLADDVMEIASSVLPFAPQPKPARAPRLQAKQASRLTRREALQRASKARQRTTYGGSDWPAFKAHILARDGRRCVVCRDRLGLTVHHLRTVGSGGRNVDSNAASVCAACHDSLHSNGRVNRRQLQAILSERHGYVYDSEQLGNDESGLERAG